MSEITMPRLSDSMESGTVISWLKGDGDQVREGEDLVEIETDKATMTHPAEASGTLEIIAREGETLPVGAPIARLGATAAAPARSDQDLCHEGPAEVLAPPAAPAAAGGPNGHRGADGVKATPLARRAASLHGVALEDVAGSGPLGRITRSDVLAKAAMAPEPAPERVAAAPRARARVPLPAPAAREDEGESELVELSRLQSVVARRMAEAKATIPHFQVQTEVDVDAAIALRRQIKAATDAAPSLNDMIVKAAALALREHPLANGSYRDGRYELHRRINIGIAVAAEGALVVPTIFDADRMSLGAIAAEARRLATRVRDGTVSPPELSGATFTVSNLGMYGMSAITPVINPPQAAILGVGATREVLARLEGEIVDRALMTLTLSCDHRILYGADAARFLSRIRELLEGPIQLVL